MCQAKQKYKIQNIFSQNTPGAHAKKCCVDLHRTRSQQTLCTDLQKYTTKEHIDEGQTNTSLTIKELITIAKNKKEVIQMRYYCLELNLNFNSSFLAYKLRDWGFTVYTRRTMIAHY